ncbi:MAG TPA: LLM class flavin-dependent oxidoreductase, partial [Acidimicrobiia bacterium]|nr:LLM class flavin-dependent oxidoreductase [Acidimicrobiia bacterium]
MTGHRPELGFYALRGHLRDPRPLLDEARRAEAIGLGSLWLSERFDVKDLAVLCGAAAAVTSRLGVATGVINPQTRSLPVLASMGATLQTLSGGRFTMGFGRAFSWQWDRWGLPQVSAARLEETVTLLRRLWAGERIEADTAFHGSLRGASIGFELERPPPLFLAAL